MCGIGGKIYWNTGTVLDHELFKIKEFIDHRGPDDSGIYISTDKKVGLVNTRLAIVDVSPNGHQPMSYQNRYWIVFNGEIYNFVEQKKRLEKMGEKFRTGTDTEVILALFHREGINCVNYLRGMFAFAIYDSVKRTIFLARDRMGKKPLKYYFDSKVFIFASELKAILTQKEVHKSPDNEAIEQYLNYGYTPAPLTGFLGIYKLEPAHYLLINLGDQSLQKKRYWNLNFNDKIKMSEKNWGLCIREKLFECVKLRMHADVPVGVLLSGGVDSSAVVAAMSNFSDKPIKTFTVRFPDKSEDESEYALNISRLFHTEYIEVEAKVNNIPEMLPMLVNRYEEPFADNSSIVSNLVSELAKKYVTVALNGDGGDENFGGYHKHLKLFRDASIYPFRRPLRYLGYPIINSLVGVTGSTELKKISKYINSIDETPLEKFIKYGSFFKNHTSEIYQSKFSESGAHDIRDCALYADIKYFLPDYLLAKMDIAGMYNHLEYRSPWLDHEMVELAAKIPFDLKVKNGESKYILKKALCGLVPKENLYRPKKGFTIPLGKWFEDDLRKYAKSKLLSPHTDLKKIFKTLNAKEMLKTHSQNNDNGLKLWNLLCLQLWYENFFD